MTELKPCPFCGGEAFVSECLYSCEPGRITTKVVECNGCHTTTFEYDTKEEAIEAWNNRTESEEQKFTRQFIHEHGLEFALASAWNGRKKNGK